MEKLNVTEFIPVGGKLKVGFKTFKAIRTKDSLSCKKCCFYETGICYLMRDYVLGDCAADNRPDGKEVYFVECNE